MVTLFVAATLAFRRPEAVAAAAADAHAEPLHQSSEIALATPPVAPPSAPTAARPAVGPVTPRSTTEPAEKAGLTRAEKDQIAESATPAAAVAAISEALGKIDPTATVPAAEAVSAEPPIVSPEPAESGAVTITGCLERSVNDKGFRLTDTEGVDAPRSRSWRTGFLKKGSTSIDLVNPPDPHALQTQVGQRIAATGLLTSRELRMISLRVISPRCN
jgi:hypothetical protein